MYLFDSWVEVLWWYLLHIHACSYEHTYNGEPFSIWALLYYNYILRSVLLECEESCCSRLVRRKKIYWLELVVREMTLNILVFLSSFCHRLEFILTWVWGLLGNNGNFGLHLLIYCDCSLVLLIGLEIIPFFIFCKQIVDLIFFC